MDFAREVQPLFAQRCYLCHGPRQQMAGLRLDRADAAQAKVIVAGKSSQSKLIDYVGGKGKVVMPPAGPHLSASEVALLARWVDQGAKWAGGQGAHWSFVKPVPPAVPSGTANPIDGFILARLKKEGLAASPEADRPTLIRRLSLDLTGLPPTPREVEHFLADARPDAYEQLVDRLLASPHFGEKWARHWLDLARYADSDGYEKDSVRPWAWRYRNWVIDAYNRDLPFDQFTIQQLAGDLLPNATLEQRVATGFHRNTLTNREGGTDPEQFRHEQMLDRASTTGAVWLGLTFGCAPCHDHKYDPITQRDYYRMYAFFNTSEETLIDAPVGGELGPWLAAKPEYDRERDKLLRGYKVPETQAKWEEKSRYVAAHPGELQDWDFYYGVLRVMLDNGVRILHMPPEERSARQKILLTDFFLNNAKSLMPAEFKELNYDELKKKLADLSAKLPVLSQAPVLVEMRKAPQSFLHIKGEWKERGAEVTPATPGFLAGETPARPNRMALATWLVSPDNPLTARVAINRIWQEVFGRGLVRTSEDFGIMGDKPSHPELLDWLAVEFMSRGWSQKQMIRLMVTSKTYRQSSVMRPELLTKDPENVLLSRQSRLRLPAELIRDEALAVSGLLNAEIGGRSVRPPQPAGVAEQSYAGSVKWPESKGPDRYRRGLYILFQRTVPYPMLVNFDEPSSTLVCSRRQRSNTPLQALNLLNDPVFFEAAQGLAYRIVREGPATLPERLEFAYRLALGRKPTAHEARRVAQFYDRQRTSLAPNTLGAIFPAQFEGVSQVDAAAWVGVSRALFNLDEFITRE